MRYDITVRVREKTNYEHRIVEWLARNGWKLFARSTDMTSGAILSADGLYRYRLLRYQETGKVVAAWGAHTNPRLPASVAAAKSYKGNWWCLGTTKNGSPRHPLYVKADQPLQLFRSDPE